MFLSKSFPPQRGERGRALGSIGIRPDHGPATNLPSVPPRCPTSEDDGDGELAFSAGGPNGGSHRILPLPERQTSATLCRSLPEG